MGEDIDLADLVPKVYEPISSWDVLQTKLMDSMNKMNEEIRGSNMDLVFFKDSFYHQEVYVSLLFFVLRLAIHVFL